MDPWSIAVGLGICLVSSVLIYIIMMFSMKEKTYEEVIAEQKQRQAIEREKEKSDKKLEKEQLKKKYKKGKGDKSKEKTAQPEPKMISKNEKGQEKEHKMVNLEIEPEIIEETDSVKLGHRNGPKHNSAAKKRSILHNKDESTPVAKSAIELPHKPIKPLDDLELKKLHEAQVHGDLSSGSTKKGKGQKQIEQKQEVKEVKVQRVKATETQSGIAPEVRKADKSKNVGSGEGRPAKGSHLIDSLRMADLSDKEVQSLVEILVKRHGADVDFQGSWNKKGQKGDPATLMKKQFEEKEKALQEEQQKSTSFANRIKELRTEVAAEKEKTSVLEKRLQGQLSQQTAEKDALTARLSTIHETHVAEMAKVRFELQQMEANKSDDAAMCAKLKQENKILQDTLSKTAAENAVKGDVGSLKQKVSIMEKELANSAVKLNASENAKKSSDEKIKKYEDQIKQLKKFEEQMKHLESSKASSEDSLKKKAEEATKEKSKADAENNRLNNDLKKANGALASAQTECTTLKTKLQELEKHLSTLDANKDLGTKLQESERRKEEVEGNLKNTEKQLADAVHAKQEATAQLQKLRQENSALTQELKVAQEKQQTQPPPATNGDVKPDPAKIIQITEHERIVSEKTAELSKVQTELAAQAKKNQEEVSRAVCEAEAMDKGVLTRLFPAISVKDQKDHKAWLASFEKQAAKMLAESSKSEHSEKDRIQELEEENRKLRQQSETYEKNFTQLNADKEKLVHLEEENQRLKTASSTNSSLSKEVSRLEKENKALQTRLGEKEDSIAEVEKKLHNLENVIETEEKKWKEKLQEAEEASSKASESSGREKELEELTIQQQTQIEHYRTVLSNTENVLRQLESTEKAWEEKYQTSQADLEKAKSDCQKMQEELHALRGSTEMQGKIDDLEEELRQSNDRLNDLHREKEELASKMIVLESQTKAVAQVNSEDLRKEMEELKQQLEGERKRNKELSSTLVRLNGIIKTGQDALSQEQKVVKQLQEQLSEKTKGSGGSREIEQGTSASSDTGTSV